MSVSRRLLSLLCYSCKLMSQVFARELTSKPSVGDFSSPSAGGMKELFRSCSPKFHTAAVAQSPAMTKLTPGYNIHCIDKS